MSVLRGRAAYYNAQPLHQHPDSFRRFLVVAVAVPTVRVILHQGECAGTAWGGGGGRGALPTVIVYLRYTHWPFAIDLVPRQRPGQSEMLGGVLPAAGYLSLFSARICMPVAAVNNKQSYTIRAATPHRDLTIAHPGRPAIAHPSFAIVPWLEHTG